MAAADLTQRQLWWILTAISSVAGIALVAYAPNLIFRVLGIAVIAIPHIAGAPLPTASDGLVPADLAAQFVSASLATAGLFWLMLGALTGHFVGRELNRE
jgi:predicted cobalt transporter CbtA